MSVMAKSRRRTFTAALLKVATRFRPDGHQVAKPAHIEEKGPVVCGSRDVERQSVEERLVGGTRGKLCGDRVLRPLRGQERGKVKFAAGDFEAGNILVSKRRFADDHRDDRILPIAGCDSGSEQMPAWLGFGIVRLDRLARNGKHAVIFALMYVGFVPARHHQHAAIAQPIEEIRPGIGGVELVFGERQAAGGGRRPGVDQ